MKDSTVWLKSVKYYTKEIKPPDSDDSITDRQERIAGFEQSVMNNLRVIQIGAGGLGGEITQGLVRKGVGFLKVFDADTVELSNLSRQFFYKEDLYKNKSLCLARNLVKEGVNKTQITAYPIMFQKAVEEKINTDCDIVICAPDNDETRIYASRYFHNRAPVIFTGLDQNANTGYVFIQETGGACLGCALPQSINNRREPCPNTPAVIDLVKIIAGLTLFAIDSTVMKRKRNWNYRQIFMGGFVPEVVKRVEREGRCSLCNGKSI